VSQAAPNLDFTTINPSGEPSETPQHLNADETTAP
jgi:hypothetical protein